MKIVCRITGHHRSAQRAKFDYERELWRSVCRHCGEPMVRLSKGEWRLDPEVSEKG